MIRDIRPAADYDIEVTEEIYRQGNDGEWPVRLYRPLGDGPFPALLDVHGGAWSNGSYLNNERVDGPRLAQRHAGRRDRVPPGAARSHTYPAQSRT